MRVSMRGGSIGLFGNDKIDIKRFKTYIYIQNMLKLAMNMFFQVLWAYIAPVFKVIIHYVICRIYTEVQHRTKVYLFV